MGNLAIAIHSLNKYYDDHHALKDIDLTIGIGETVVICGPSGSGKSTLIRCVNGLEQFSDGELVVLDTPVDDDTRNLNAIRKRVGMVFQNFNLFPHLTVLENCVLPQIRAAGKTRENAIIEAETQLSNMHIAEHLNKYPDQISGGQQQRVALARALCLKPEIMLFDEPTSALDPEMIAEVLEVMQELANQNMTIMCVTHEMGFARKVADSIVLMADGRIVERGEPEQIFNSPRNQITREFIKAIST